MHRMAVAVVRRNAFSLVELLVVIGIIAMLISLLLPALNRSRESARQVTCLSNVRQIVIGLVMYCNDNHGVFPRPAPEGFGEQPDDWIYWQNYPTNPAYLRSFSDAPIARYVSKTPNVFRCPSDNYMNRPNAITDGEGPYTYSYTLCNRMTSVQEAYNADIAYRITAVRRSSEKVLLYEESESTIDDGAANPYGTTFAGVPAFQNLLSIRHDHNPVLPDVVMGTGPTAILPNPGKKGNAGFCDGHAAYISRNYLHRADNFYAEPSLP